MFKIIDEKLVKISDKKLENGDYVIVCSGSNNEMESREISYIMFDVKDSKIILNDSLIGEWVDDDDYCDKVSVVEYCDLIIENWVEGEYEVILIRLS